MGGGLIPRSIMLIHEEPAEYASWYKLIFLILIGLFIFRGVISLLNRESEAFLSLLGVGVFLILLYYFLIPRRYQIYHDKLKIVLGSPLSIDIPLSTIKEVKHNSGIKTLVYPRARFLTSTKYVIEVVRNKGLNYVISPKNGEIFLEKLNQAIENEAGNKY